MIKGLRVDQKQKKQYAQTTQKDADQINMRDTRTWNTPDPRSLAPYLGA